MSNYHAPPPLKHVVKEYQVPADIALQHLQTYIAATLEKPQYHPDSRISESGVQFASSSATGGILLHQLRRAKAALEGKRLDVAPDQIIFSNAEEEEQYLPESNDSRLDAQIAASAQLRQDEEGQIEPEIATIEEQAVEEQHNPDWRNENYQEQMRHIDDGIVEAEAGDRSNFVGEVNEVPNVPESSKKRSRDADDDAAKREARKRAKKERQSDVKKERETERKNKNHGSAVADRRSQSKEITQAISHGPETGSIPVNQKLRPENKGEKEKGHKRKASGTPDPARSDEQRARASVTDGTPASPQSRPHQDFASPVRSILKKQKLASHQIALDSTTSGSAKKVTIKTPPNGSAENHADPNNQDLATSSIEPRTENEFSTHPEASLEVATSESREHRKALKKARKAAKRAAREEKEKKVELSEPRQRSRDITDTVGENQLSISSSSGKSEAKKEKKRARREARRADKLDQTHEKLPDGQESTDSQTHRSDTERKAIKKARREARRAAERDMAVAEERARIEIEKARLEEQKARIAEEKARLNETLQAVRAERAEAELAAERAARAQEVAEARERALAAERLRIDEERARADDKALAEEKSLSKQTSQRKEAAKPKKQRQKATSKSGKEPPQTSDDETTNAPSITLNAIGADIDGTAALSNDNAQAMEQITSDATKAEAKKNRKEAAEKKKKAQAEQQGSAAAGTTMPSKVPESALLLPQEPAATQAIDLAPVNTSNPAQIMQNTAKEAIQAGNETMTATSDDAETQKQTELDQKKAARKAKRREQYRERKERAQSEQEAKAIGEASVEEPLQNGATDSNTDGHPTAKRINEIDGNTKAESEIEPDQRQTPAQADVNANTIQEGLQTPKKRGRPKGSKNKPKPSPESTSNSNKIIGDQSNSQASQDATGSAQQPTPTPVPFDKPEVANGLEEASETQTATELQPEPIIGQNAVDSATVEVPAPTAAVKPKRKPRPKSVSPKDLAPTGESVGALQPSPEAGIAPISTSNGETPEDMSTPKTGKKRGPKPGWKKAKMEAEAAVTTTQAADSTPKVLAQEPALDSGHVTKADQLQDASKSTIMPGASHAQAPSETDKKPRKKPGPKPKKNQDDTASKATEPSPSPHSTLTQEHTLATLDASESVPALKPTVATQEAHKLDSVPPPSTQPKAKGKPGPKPKKSVATMASSAGPAANIETSQDGAADSMASTEQTSPTTQPPEVSQIPKSDAVPAPLSIKQSKSVSKPGRKQKLKAEVKPVTSIATSESD